MHRVWGEYQYISLYISLQVQVVAGSTDDERMSTANLVWRDMVFGQSAYPHGTVISGGGFDGSINYACRCLVPETSVWMLGWLDIDIHRCYYELYGTESCDVGQILVYVDCEGLNCPNDYPAKCEHSCPDV